MWIVLCCCSWWNVMRQKRTKTNRVIHSPRSALPDRVVWFQQTKHGMPSRVWISVKQWRILCYDFVFCHTGGRCTLINYSLLNWNADLLNVLYLAPLPTDPNSRELCVYPYLLLERSAQQTQNTLRTALKGQTGKDKDLTPSSSFVTPDVQHHIAVPKVKHPCVSACQFAPARTYLEHASRAPSHNHEGWCFTCNALPGSGDSPTPM